MISVLRYGLLSYCPLLLSLVEHWLTVNPYRLLSKLLYQYNRPQEHTPLKSWRKTNTSCHWYHTWTGIYTSSTFQRGKGTRWPCHQSNPITRWDTTHPQLDQWALFAVQRPPRRWHLGFFFEAEAARRVNHELIIITSKSQRLTLSSNLFLQTSLCNLTW